MILKLIFVYLYLKKQLPTYRYIKLFFKNIPLNMDKNDVFKLYD